MRVSEKPTPQHIDTMSIRLQVQSVRLLVTELHEQPCITVMDRYVIARRIAELHTRVTGRRVRIPERNADLEYRRRWAAAWIGRFRQTRDLVCRLHPELAELSDVTLEFPTDAELVRNQQRREHVERAALAHAMEEEEPDGSVLSSPLDEDVIPHAARPYTYDLA